MIPATSSSALNYLFFIEFIEQRRSSLFNNNNNIYVRMVSIRASFYLRCFKYLLLRWIWRRIIFFMTNPSAMHSVCQIG